MWLVSLAAVSPCADARGLWRLPSLAQYERPWIIEPPLPTNAMDVAGIGRVVVSPGEDPVDAVEAFAARATHSGHALKLADMHALVEALCSRMPCARQLTGSVALSFAVGGECECAAAEDPVDAVFRCVRAAVRRGLGPTRYEVVQMIRSFCALKACVVEPPPALTADAGQLGYLTVEAWEEPAEVVERLARTLAAGGRPLNRDLALVLVDWFCERRECLRGLAPDLNAGGVDCLYWEPPEYAVLRAPSWGDTSAALDYLCERKPCGRGLERKLEVSVWSSDNASVGALACGPLEEPADCVEAFVRRSLAFGYKLAAGHLSSAMGSMMAWLCERRHCSRSLAPEIQLLSDGSPLVVARSWEEPWQAASNYARLVHAEGSSAPRRSAQAVYLDICRHRASCVDLPADVGVVVRGVGNLTCRSWEQPADVVESFAYEAVRVGHVLRARDLNRILDLMCSQRSCSRRKLSVVASLLVMHPGKTAGRAIGAATRPSRNVFVLGHDNRCGDDSRPCFVVLRHPVDRFVSALAFKKQAGEHRGELLLGNLCYAWLTDKHVDDVVDDLAGLNEHCDFARARPAQSTHCVFRSAPDDASAPPDDARYRAQAPDVVGRRQRRPHFLPLLPSSPSRLRRYDQAPLLAPLPSPAPEP